LLYQRLQIQQTKWELKSQEKNKDETKTSINENISHIEMNVAIDTVLAFDLPSTSTSHRGSAVIMGFL
jgi:hypothetical protein